MSKIIKLSFLILALPTIAVLLGTVLDKVFSDTVVWYLDEFIDWLDRFLWSHVTNLLLSMVSLILILNVTRFIFWFITWRNEED